MAHEGLPEASVDTGIANRIEVSEEAGIGESAISDLGGGDGGGGGFRNNRRWQNVRCDGE